LAIVDVDGDELVPARIWNCAPPPEILGGQAKPLAESVPARSCQQPDVLQSRGAPTETLPSNPDQNSGLPGLGGDVWAGCPAGCPGAVEASETFCEGAGGGEPPPPPQAAQSVNMANAIAFLCAHMGPPFVPSSC